MGKNKKRFIDKNNSITFTLVHRSQKDPLLVDESAPQHVLKPISSANSLKNKKKRKEEQMKYGIYFEDEYDYLQHLRDPKDHPVEMERVFIPTKTKNKTAANLMNELNSPLPSSSTPSAARLQLPSSVFASQYEEKVGLLNKAAPESGLRLDLDPDIVAAMDEDFDFDNPDNQLEDDFVLRAKGNNGDFEEEEEDNFYKDSGSADHGDDKDMSSDFSSENDQFDENDARLKMFDNEETKSRFTEYSMSSSVIRRNENLSYLDDHFETMFAKYDDTEIGALECEDIEGDILTNDQRLLMVAEEFEKEREVEKFNQEKNADLLARIAEESEVDSSEDEFERMVIQERNKWDCESILSTYSNIYNHPTLITEAKTSKIRFNPKTGLPITPATSKLTPALLAAHEDIHAGIETSGHKGPGSVISAITTLSIRDKNETPEERRTRKNALKEYRKERRIEKKANKMAFKDEKKRVEKQFLHTRVQKQGVHL